MNDYLPRRISSRGKRCLRPIVLVRATFCFIRAIHRVIIYCKPTNVTQTTHFEGTRINQIFQSASLISIKYELKSFQWVRPFNADLLPVRRRKGEVEREHFGNIKLISLDFFRGALHEAGCRNDRGTRLVLRPVGDHSDSSIRVRHGIPEGTILSIHIFLLFILFRSVFSQCSISHMYLANRKERVCLVLKPPIYKMPHEESVRF